MNKITKFVFSLSLLFLITAVFFSQSAFAASMDIRQGDMLSVVCFNDPCTITNPPQGSSTVTSTPISAATSTPAPAQTSTITNPAIPTAASTQCTVGDVTNGYVVGSQCCSTANGQGGTCVELFQTLNNNSSIHSLGDIVTIGKNFLFIIVGLTVVAVILYGGFTYMTAQGEPEKIKKAQGILLYAFIGVAVIALSVIIVDVVQSVLGINISNFLK